MAQDANGRSNVTIRPFLVASPTNRPIRPPDTRLSVNTHVASVQERSAEVEAVIGQHVQTKKGEFGHSEKQLGKSSNGGIILERAARF